MENGFSQSPAYPEKAYAQGGPYIVSAYHVVMVSLHRKDPSVLLNTGWDLKHRASYNKSPNTGKLTVPSKFTVKHGTVSGTVVATVNRAQTAASVELQVTDGDPSLEASWKGLGMFFQCRMEAKGLEPARRYHFRARYQSAGATGPWSQHVSLIVI